MHIYKSVPGGKRTSFHGRKTRVHARERKRLWASYGYDPTKGGHLWWEIGGVCGRREGAGVVAS